MPVLDTEMWLGVEHERTGIPEDALEAGDALEAKAGPPQTVILYNFYKKKIANRIPSLEASASPMGQKIATTSQEIIRRLKNSSLDLPPEETEENLKRYMDELKAGGFSEEFRIKVLDAAMKGFLKFWRLQKS